MYWKTPVLQNAGGKYNAILTQQSGVTRVKGFKITMFSIYSPNIENITSKLKYQQMERFFKMNCYTIHLALSNMHYMHLYKVW